MSAPCAVCALPFEAHAEHFGLQPGHVSNCALSTTGTSTKCQMCNGKCPGPHPYSKDHRVIATFTGTYAFLSDRYPAIVSLYERSYLTVTHAYLAARCVNVKDQEVFREPFLADPQDAWEHSMKLAQRSDWASIEEATHNYLLYQKFTQNPLLSWYLQATGTAPLMEDASDVPGLGARLFALRESLWTPPF